MDSLVLIGGPGLNDFPFSLDTCKALIRSGKNGRFIDYLITQYKLLDISDTVYLLGSSPYKRDISRYIDELISSWKSKIKVVYDTDFPGSGGVVYDTFYRYELSDVLVVKSDFLVDTDYDFSQDEPNTRYETLHLQYGILRLNEDVIKYSPDSQTFSIDTTVNIAMDSFEIPVKTVHLPYTNYVSHETLDDIAESRTYFNSLPRLEF